MSNSHRKESNPTYLHMSYLQSTCRFLQFNSKFFLIGSRIFIYCNLSFSKIPFILTLRTNLIKDDNYKKTYAYNSAIIKVTFKYIMVNHNHHVSIHCTLTCTMYIDICKPQYRHPKPFNSNYYHF